MEANKGLISQINIFKGLGSSELKLLISLLKEKTVRKDGIVLNQEDPGDALYIIKEGKVKVVLFGEEGKEFILSTLKSGDFFGEMSLLDGEPRSASVVATKEAKLLVLERDDFLNFVRNSPDIALNILAELSRRLRRTDEKIASLALLDVYGRVAHALIELARNEGEEIEEGILIRERPTQQDLANMIGTSRETVSRVLRDLARSGLIAVSGKQVIILGNLSDFEDTNT
jgi:CRP/FNR family transcriptional regulator, cyclic AMP receptor protein